MAFLDLVSAAIDIAGGAEWLHLFVAPWRFVCSKPFRERKREEWQRAPAFHAAVEAVGGVIFALLDIAIVAFFIFVFWSALHSRP
jgi:hypothetical protein